jgi:large subunit ribosomal protein L24
MSTKIHIRKGDTVKVIAGDSKGQQGKVTEVFPDENRALVEGVNMVTRHSKPTSKNPQGGILKQEAPIHISNLMVVMGGKASKIGRKIDPKTNKSVRYSKKSGEVIK